MVRRSALVHLCDLDRVSATTQMHSKATRLMKFEVAHAVWIWRPRTAQHHLILLGQARISATSLEPKWLRKNIFISIIIISISIIIIISEV